jgi:hypothetical protein
MKLIIALIFGVTIAPPKQEVWLITPPQKQFDPCNYMNYHTREVCTQRLSLAI